MFAPTTSANSEPGMPTNAHCPYGHKIVVVVTVVVGSRPSDHYFRSVCLFVCAEFFSAVFDPISIKLGSMLYVWI